RDSRVSRPERGAYSTPRSAPKPRPARNHMKPLPPSRSDIAQPPERAMVPSTEEQFKYRKCALAEAELLTNGLHPAIGQMPDHTMWHRQGQAFMTGEAKVFAANHARGDPVRNGNHNPALFCQPGANPLLKMLVGLAARRLKPPFRIGIAAHNAFTTFVDLVPRQPFPRSQRHLL